MLLLDFSIVSIALPEIQSGMHIGAAPAQWLISAYAIIFAGFLLLFGRLADIVGRRRIFAAGLALFTAASFVAGIAQNAELLILMRALQGLGAAAVNPAALGIVTAIFTGERRSRAIGLWGVAGSSGIVIGMLLGGIIVAFLGWRWVFFVNVPFGVLVLALTPALVPADRFDRVRPKLDAWGALTLTAALLLVTFAIVRAPGDGTAATILRLAGVVVLAIAYWLIERRVAQPLVPARLFFVPDFTPAMALSVVQAAAYAGIYVYVSEYLQRAAHLSALATGLFYIPATLVMTCISGPSSAPLTNRLGARSIAVFGAIFMCAGCLLMIRTAVPGIPVATGLLPALVIASFGCMYTYEISMIAALAKVSEDDESLASAAVSMAAQMGLSLGVAVAAAFEMQRTAALHAAGLTPQAALAGGLNAAFWSPLLFSVLSLIASVTLRGTAGAVRRHFRFGKLALHSGRPKAATA